VSLDVSDDLTPSSASHPPLLDSGVQESPPDHTGLFVWCAWRLTRNGKPVCTWRYPNDMGGIAHSALNALIGLRIVEVRFGLVTPDILLAFDDGTTFEALCDISDDEESDWNYLVFLPDIVIEASLDFALEKKSRDSS
jgi:hypothetical protein